MSHNEVNLILKIHNIEKEMEVYVIGNNNFSYDLLLGLDTIQKFHLQQDDQLNIFQRLDNDRIEIVQKNDDNSIEKINIKKKDNREDISVFNPNEIMDLQETLNHLNQEKKEELIKVIKKYSSVSAKNNYDVGRVRSEEAHVKLLENKYISKKPYRCSVPDQ